MIYHILTIFPDIFSSYFNKSIICRAQEKGIIKINIINIRDFANNKHKTVDDCPYGGGAGMIMKVEPIYNALLPFHKKKKKRKIVLLTPTGKK